MPRKHDSKCNVEKLTDGEMSAAVRYLDPDSSCEIRGEGDSSVLMMSA